MKNIAILFLIITLSGCRKRIDEGIDVMTNDQIIETTRKCEAAGLDGDAERNPFANGVVKINCVPRKHVEYDRR